MAEPKEPLTERELEIVRLVGTGAGNKEIAALLSVSPNTVKVHLRNIFTKLEASSRTEVTMIAVRNGWIALRGPELAPAPGMQPEQPSEPAPTGSLTLPTEVGSAVSPTDQLTQAPATQLNGTVGGSTERPPTPVVVVPVAPNPEPLPRLAIWKRAALLAGLALSLVLVVVTVSAAQGDSTAPVDPLRIGPAQPRNDLLLRGEVSRWSLRAPLPAARARSAAATVGDLIYVIGGEVNQSVSGDVLTYVPITNTWLLLNSPKPTPVANAPAAVVGSVIYIAGGTGRGGDPSSAMEAFDTATRQWRRLAPLPNPVAGHATVALGSQVYVFGGATDGGVSDASLRYDTTSNTWRAIRPMPTARTLSAAVVFDDRIFVVGGYNAGHELNDCEVYTPAQDAWSDCKPMTLPRSGLGLVRVGPNLFAVGGGMNGFLGFNERYDPATNRWTALDTPITNDWQSIAVAGRPTEFYVFGGYSGGERLALAYVYEVFTNRVFVPAFQSSPGGSQKP